MYRSLQFLIALTKKLFLIIHLCPHHERMRWATRQQR